MLLKDGNFSYGKSKVKEKFINYFKKVLNDREEHGFNEKK